MDSATAPAGQFGSRHTRARQKPGKRKGKKTGSTHVCDKLYQCPAIVGRPTSVSSSASCNVVYCTKSLTGKIKYNEVSAQSYRRHVTPSFGILPKSSNRNKARAILHPPLCFDHSLITNHQFLRFLRPPPSPILLRLPNLATRDGDVHHRITRIHDTLRPVGKFAIVHGRMRCRNHDGVEARDDVSVPRH